MSTPTTPQLSPLDPSLTNAYLVVGLATCFVKQDGKLEPVQVIEPISSASLEVILQGIPTSYTLATATTLASLQPGNIQLPTDFPTDSQLGQDFWERATAAARTYLAKPIAQTHLPIGQIQRDFNFSTERKRVLNAERLVSASDNVKQHAYTHQVL
jgi:hypothetical protein